ncbi:MAG TPA: copper transporter [Trebonia sp.]|nr:copper transporter [Trebonia sp.]
MIDFRYHLVSIVAVFLALAIGIVLGSTELQGVTLSGLQGANNSLHSQLNAASDERDAYQAQDNAAQAFLQDSEPLLLGSGHLLEKDKIVLITEPGAPSSVIGGVKTAAADAGASVIGQVALQPSFNSLSAATSSTLSTANDTIASSAGVTLPIAPDQQVASQQQAAQLIAGTLLRNTAQPTTSETGGGQPTGQPTQSVQPTHSVQPTTSATTGASASPSSLLGSYVKAGFITLTGSLASRANVAVIVTPSTVPVNGGSDPTNEVLVAIAQVFAQASQVTVVAGAASPSGQPGSAMAVVRASSIANAVSTVDDADSVQGQVTVMQAIAVQLAGGKPSSYGISGASSMSPNPAPTPVPTATSTPSTGSGRNNGKQVKKK